MPRKAVDSEVRLRSLNLKTTEALRSRLEEAAARSGRALTHEVESRLDHSLSEESALIEILGGEGRAFCVMTFAAGLKQVSDTADRLFSDDADRELKKRIMLAKFVSLLGEDLSKTVPSDVDWYKAQKPELESAAIARCVLRRWDLPTFKEAYPGDEEDSRDGLSEQEPKPRQRKG